MQICSQCQLQNPDGPNYCQNCAAALAAVCPACQRPLPDQSGRCAHCGLQLSGAPTGLRALMPSTLAEKIRIATPQIAGQKRPVTVLYLSNRTPAGQPTAADDEAVYLREQALTQLLAEAVYAYEGHIAEISGQSLVAIFGAPVMHENHAERAIRAALGLKKSRQAPPPTFLDQYGPPPEIAIGVNSGTVIVANVGSAVTMEYAAVGDTINLAAALAQAASPGSILVTAATRELTQPLFEFQPRAVDIAAPAQVYEPLAARPRLSRLRSLSGSLAPMIGRQELVAQLIALRDQLALNQRSQLVLLTGEAGIGKSRLLLEFQNSLLPADAAATPAPARFCQGVCQAHTRSRPYGVITHILRCLMQIDENEPPETQLQRLTAFLASYALNQSQVRPFLAYILGLAAASPEIQARLELFNGDMLQKLIHNGLRQLLAALARQSPLIIAVEDLHWIDAASLNALNHLLPATDSLPILYICTSRDGAAAQLLSGPRPAVAIHLDALSGAESGLLIEQFIHGVDTLEPNLTRSIAARAAGNPFFIEEIIRMLIGMGGVISQDSVWRVSAEAETYLQQVPETLQALILARFDSLDDQLRQTLLQAAVLGAVFSSEILAALAALPHETAAGQMQELVLHEFLDPDPQRDNHFSFRHALMQETLYGAMLPRQRQTLHEQAAEALEKLADWPAVERDQLLAHHYSYGRQPQRAIPYLLKTAENAAQQSANETAVEQFQKAVELLTEDKSEIGEALFQAKIGLGRAHKFLGNYERAHSILDELLQALLSWSIRAEPGSLMRVLAAAFREKADVQMRKGDYRGAIANLEAGLEALGAQGAQEHPLLYRFLVERMAFGYFRQGRLDMALQVAQSALATVSAGDANDDPVVMATLYNSLGGIYWQQGNLELAASYVRQCLQLFEQLGFPWGIANAYSNLGLLNWQQGNWDQALHDFQKDFALRQEMGDKQYEALTLLNLAQVRLNVGDFSQAESDLLSAQEILNRLDDRYNIALVNAMLAQHALAQQQIELAAEYAQTAILLADKVGAQLIQIEARGSLALAQAELGEPHVGLATMREAAEMAAASGAISGEADCLRITGRLLAQIGELTAAETNLRESIELCRQISDPYRQGLALLELGRLYRPADQTEGEKVLGRYQRCQAALKEALGIFLTLGARHDQQQTEDALALLQANPPRIQSAAAAEATAQPDLPFGQRRAATILWLNLVWPDGGADEEAVFEMTANALPALAAIAQEHGGYVRQRPNGLTVAFGVPAAYEDDTERAVLTAYRIMERLRAADSQPEFPLAVQAVVASGPVFVGQAAEGRQEELIIRGQPVDQAQYATALVPPGAVWVTDSVRLVTERIFTYHNQPQRDLVELSLWRLLELRDMPDPARGLPGVRTRFVGREASLQAVVDLTQNLPQGIGGIVWIEGEAGIGKSRLMREFSATLTADAYLILKGGCSPQQSNYAFALIADLLKPFFNIQRADSGDQIRRKIEQTLSAWPDDVQAVQPYLELLVGIQPLGWTGERLARLEPEQLRQQTFVAVRRLLISLARRQPLVVFLDDLHWIDPVSAELLLFVFTAVTSVPIFFVCGQRREGSDSPNDRLLRLYSLLPGQTAHIMLDRLPPAMSRLLLTDLLPGASLSPELQNAIIARSEGNPYFIEEFVRMFIEQGYVEKEGEQWRLATTIAYDAAAIPASLETLIRSRVDALPEELRHTLQYAAILGQKFEIELLAAITNNPNVWLSVERLASRLMLESVADGNRWQFSHTLYETVVYDSMLKVHRRLRHHHAAQMLQQLWSDGETDHAKELAYHFMRADEPLKALPYLIRAGEQAANQYATEEALAYYRSASEISTQLLLPDAEWQWRIAVGLGEAHRFLGNYAESLIALQTSVPLELLPPLKQADLYRRMAETARKQGDFTAAENYLTTAQELLGDPEDGAATLELSRILIGLAWVSFAQGQLAETREACEKGLAHAQAADGLNELATAHNLLGGVYYQLGEWRDAFHHTTRAMILREQMGYSWGVAGTLSNMGILAFVAGNWHKSVSFFERSLNLRREIGDVEGIAITLNNLGSAYRGQGKLEEAERSFRESVLTAEAFQINYHHANSAVGLAHVLLLQGKLAEAQSWIEHGVRQAEAIGAQDILAEGQRIQAELLLENQAPEPARQTAEKAAALAAAVGNPSYEAAAWRVAAQAALAQRDSKLAEKLIQKATALLTDTTDHLEAAHAAAQAYRIYRQTGEERLARENLAAAREAFTRLGAAHYLRQLEQSETLLTQKFTQ